MVGNHYTRAYLIQRVRERETLEKYCFHLMFIRFYVCDIFYLKTVV